MEQQTLKKVFSVDRERFAAVSKPMKNIPEKHVLVVTMAPTFVESTFCYTLNLI